MLIGYKSRAKAQELSAYADRSWVVELSDGKFVGAGPITNRNGKIDIPLYGAKGSHAWASDVERMGGVKEK